MSKQLSAPFVPMAVDAARSSDWLRPAGVALAGSALVALCTHLVLPLYFTPVPLTLGPLAMLVVGFALSPRMAAATLGAYLAEGALGLPVFAPVPLLSGGLAHLFGPTGGYLLSYPLAAALISWLWRGSGRGYSAALLSAAAGNLVILTCGALWLAILTHTAAQSVIALAVLPFLPGDALKIAAAAALAVGFERRRRRAV